MRLTPRVFRCGSKQLQVQNLHSTCHWVLERVILLHALLQQDDALLLHNAKPTAMGGQTFNNRELVELSRSA